MDNRIQRRTRALFISDLHNKRFGKNNEKLLAAIREQKVDCVILGGDILTATPGKDFTPAVEFLREVVKICPVYYGNGNHEQRIKLYPETYGYMATRYGQALEEIGICPIVNDSRILEGSGICIFGAEIDRKFYKRFSKNSMDVTYLNEILGTPDPSKCTVLIAHHPDYFPVYTKWGADLVLSGHVHGGVARVPIWGKGVLSPSLKLFPKYDGGFFAEGRGTMILNRGLGSHTIPVRVLNPGEMWLIDFRPD
jgi:predicted MPP superfamily phosphohydrolase